MSEDTRTRELAVRITAICDWFAARAAPAMPWLFLALRRALIPTLAWVVVATLFFVLPQSREVLHGLSEPVLKSFTDFDANDRTSINVWALASYIATAVVMAMAIWYSARLLATVDADRGAPNALETWPGSVGLKRANVWYPRGLGVTALAAAIGALIYANYTPRLSHTLALALAVCAIAGPLLAAIGSLLATREAPPLWSRLWIVIGALLIALTSVLLMKLHLKWPMWLWMIGSTMLPALLLMFLVRRRRVMGRVSVRRARPHAAPVQDAASARRFGDVIVTIVGLVLFGAGSLLVLALLPPPWMRGFGSAAAILLFIGATSLLLTGMQLLIRRFARNVPGLTAAIIAVVAVLVALIGTEDLGQESLAARPQALLNASAKAPPVAADAASAPVVPRALYVNAHGGGLRAAVFTAQVLARADDATCGAFGEQVAAFSGVSGGSVGIATYLLARQELKARGGWSSDCASAGDATSAKTPLGDIVTGALVQDHLSPVIGRMLAVDAPHVPGVPIKRGQALLHSWNDALIASLSERIPNAPADTVAGFTLPLGALNGGFTRVPAVYFNATDADSGHIVWFSNVRGGFARTYNQQELQVALSVGQAVLHSARFPVVTPPGAFDPPWAPGAPVRLIDGGYADNSGTTTLFDIYTGGMAPHDAGSTPRLINIDGNPSEDSECRRAKGRPPILTAVRGLLQARTAHAARAVERLDDQIPTHRINVQLDLEAALAAPGQTQAQLCKKVDRAQQAPLGWYMSYEAAATVATSAQFGVRSVCASLDLPCRFAEVKRAAAD